MCKVLFVSVLKLDWFPGKHTVDFIQCKLMMNSISDFKQILADLFETFDSQSIKKTRWLKKKAQHWKNCFSNSWLSGLAQNKMDASN